MGRIYPTPDPPKSAFKTRRPKMERISALWDAAEFSTIYLETQESRKLNYVCKSFLVS